MLFRSISLTDFEVSKKNGSALLKWGTSSESNTKNFEEEHSTDGIHFTTAGYVAAQGNSNTFKYYTFVHQSPLPGQNYYRLKLVDRDGKATLFPVKTLQFEEGVLQPIILLQNPVMNNNIQLQVNITRSIQLKIYNLQGQNLLTKNISTAAAGRYFINLPQATPGIYILEVNSNQQRFTYKLQLQ